MSICVAVPRERAPGERRVSLTPDTVARLCKQGFEVVVEAGAGAASCFPDSRYSESGARLVTEPARLYDEAAVVLKVQAPAGDEVSGYRPGQVLVAFLQPHRNDAILAALRDRGVTSFAMERIPRITRAQAMDALSSQATVAGYKSALIAADASPLFFPMLTTAAGTIRPAKVLVLGAGVAGLQAIATARRLGAQVQAYDVRHAAREQVESLGAKFIGAELNAEADGGYARELTDDEKRREGELLRKAIHDADVVITTAQIPGRPAPRLIDADAVGGMKPGAVIVDLAAESGGNCELTRPGERFEQDGVTIHGPLNVPSLLPVHASMMYGKNLQNFLGLLRGEDGALVIDWDDEILAAAAVTHDGVIRPQAIRERVEGGQA